MDPSVVDAAQWRQIARIVELLYVFVGLTLAGAFAFLMAHAVVPSLVDTRDASDAILGFRRLLYPISALCLLLMLVAIGAAIYLSVDVLRQIYPDFLI